MAVDVEPDDLYARVVDVGPGLCVVVKAPGPAFMVYDAGHWVGTKCLKAVQEIVGSHEIELLVLSHGDGDHIGNAEKILDNFRVRQVWRTGDVRTSSTWGKANAAVGREATQQATIISLSTFPFPPGFSVPLGDAKVTFLGGWGAWDGDPTGLNAGELHNVISIVVRVDYAGGSILLTGDSIGRLRDAPDDSCGYADQVLVERDTAGTIDLDTDVVVAAHHGGNNGSSSCLIEAASPEFVVFSAGHDHAHPTAGAADRFLAAGVDLANIYRTDRGDDEDSPFHWNESSVDGCVDPIGDDDVEIALRADGSIELDYRLDASDCP